MNMYFSDKKTKYTAGFTLIEVMVSVSIFAIIATLGVGALLTTNGAYRIAQGQRIVIDDLDTALETISREIRTGTQYTCGGDFGDVHRSSCHDLSPGSTDPYDGGGCTGTNDYSFIGFCNSEREWRSFGFEDNNVIRRGGVGFGGNDELPLILSESTTVTHLLFRPIGTERVGDTQQPMVVMRVSGETNIGDSEGSFDIQTIISQRELDF